MVIKIFLSLYQPAVGHAHSARYRRFPFDGSPGGGCLVVHARAGPFCARDGELAGIFSDRSFVLPFGARGRLDEVFLLENDPVRTGWHSFVFYPAAAGGDMDG